MSALVHPSGFAEAACLEGLRGLIVIGWSQEYASFALHTPGHGLALRERGAFGCALVRSLSSSSRAEGTIRGRRRSCRLRDDDRVPAVPSGARSGSKRGKGQALCANPKTQYAGRRPVPIDAISSAREMAGALMHGWSGERLHVASSDSAPFKVEMAASPEDIDRMLAGFEESKAV